jgi:outer membrane protein TolC
VHGRRALDRAEANRRAKRGNIGDEAQARTSLAGFQASLITAQADLLQREAALRNILGIPPTDQPQMVPVTPPRTARYEVPWEEVLQTASENRPDLIELKLILEADQQQLVQASNNALPQLDAAAVYRWNGLQGRTPDLYYVGTEPGEFTGWTLGVNFSVPLGLRAGRAQLRQTELLIMRDRANVQQGLHNAAHLLATNYRNLDRYYQQYKTYQEAREAAQVSLDFQMAAYRSGQTIYLSVLLAINDWGNAIASEAAALAQYNAELASLQAQTGTILEAHDIRFVEERYCSIGPMGRFFRDQRYPQAMPPGPNQPQYETTDKPAEDIFQLNKIVTRSGRPPIAPPTRTAPEAVPLPPPAP